jgi:hypothetical protein
MLVPVLTVLPMFRAAVRPAVDGTVEELVVDGTFRIHFTRDGADAVSDDDEDANGLPDQVDTVRDTLVRARDRFETDGWRPLAPDRGEDGGTEIDVYLRVLPTNGYATPVPAADGSTSCHVQLDPGSSVAGRVLESVTVHELHHCVQFRYTANTVTWLYESGATYQQYSLVSDVVLDYAAGLLWVEWLTGHDLPLTATDGRHEYASFVFTKFWVERSGADPSRLQRLWTSLAEPDLADEQPSWLGSVDRAARAEWGDDLDTVVLDHAAWSAFAGSRDDGNHYDPDVIPNIADTQIELEPFVAGETVHHRVSPYTAAFRELVPGVTPGVTSTGGPVRVTCLGPGNTRLVAIDAKGALADQVDGEDLQVTIPTDGTALLVFAGTSARDLQRTCELAEPRVGKARSCQTGGGPLPLVALVSLAVAARRRSVVRRRP